jgi:acyl carrier protein
MTIDRVRAAISEVATLPTDDGASLDVDSLTLVSIVEAIEDAFEIRVAPREVIPEHFSSVAAIAAFIAAREKKDA